MIFEQLWNDESEQTFNTLAKELQIKGYIHLIQNKGSKETNKLFKERYNSQYILQITHEITDAYNLFLIINDIGLKSVHEIYLQEKEYLLLRYAETTKILNSHDIHTRIVTEIIMAVAARGQISIFDKQLARYLKEELKFIEPEIHFIEYTNSYLLKFVESEENVEGTIRDPLSKIYRPKEYERLLFNNFIREHTKQLDRLKRIQEILSQ